jgi:glycine/D-amino acid oxidase-like deaminating enzyme
MSLRYGRSYWLDTFPTSRRPDYPRQRGPLTADVAIVGGGLAGCATAYAFAAAGVRVALVEADRVGVGTAASSGLVLQDPGVSFQDVEALYGRRAARLVFHLVHRSALDLAATLRRLGIECGLERRDLAQVALGPEDEKALRREWQARKTAGLDATFVATRQAQTRVNLECAGALVTRGHARIDPYKACLGFARAAVKRDARIFEYSPVRRIRFSRQAAEVHTERGVMTAATVVVATGRATDLFKPLRRHFRALHRYHVVTAPLPAAVRRALGPAATAVTDTFTPPRWVQWLRDGRVMCSGGDQPEPPARAREKACVQRTGQLMYELSTLYPAMSGVMPGYGWDGAYGRAADGLPYIGPHRNYPRHLFALGCGLGGPALALLASRILLRHYQGETAKGDELFDFGRART